MARSKVTVVGSGFVGSTSAQRIFEAGIADVCLIDIIEGKPQGIALDLMQAAPVLGVEGRIVGTNNAKDTYGSDVVLMTAGLPRKPGMDRSDLLEVNGKIINDVADYVRNGSPNAVVIVVTNPLDTMVYLMQKRTKFQPERVIGMAGVLDSARMRCFLGMELHMGVSDIDAMVLGGHGDSMVPLPRFATVNGISIPNLITKERIAAINDRTRNGGAEIVSLLKTGSAYYAPSAASFAMVKAILHDERRVLPCAAHLRGQYGLEGIYMGVPCVLGAKGVEDIVELPLEAPERDLLHKSAEAIRKDVTILKQKGLLAE
ncbi:MAG TPA: malate dehydrogenase [Planctomycetota bacterium]|nr:malate dehydrogenase [Planctomycetota bacterium]